MGVLEHTRNRNFLIWVLSEGSFQISPLAEVQNVQFVHRKKFHKLLKLQWESLYKLVQTLANSD